MSEGSVYQDEPVETYEFTQGITVTCHTSADQVLADHGHNWIPTFIKRNAPQYGQEEWAGELQLTVGRTHPIAALFIPGQPEPAVTLVVRRGVRGDPLDVMWSGSVVQAQGKDDSTVTLTCVPVSAGLKRAFPGILYMGVCNWPLFSPGCGLNKATFKLSTTGTQAGTVLTLASVGGHPDGWFTNGWVELATGERRMIVSHVGLVVNLQRPFLTLAPGTAVDVYPGCDHLEAGDCTLKYSNRIHFMGFSYVPQRNPYQGSIV